MVVAQDPKAEFRYVLKADRSLPEAEQTVFILRGLTVTEDARVSDQLFAQAPGVNEMSIRVGSQQLEIVKLGLCGWENFRRGDGTEVPFRKVTRGSTTTITEETLDFIGPWLVELANAITERGKVTEDEGN